MPTYQVTDPESGRTLKLTGEAEPTEEELDEIFAEYRPEKLNPALAAVSEFASAVNRGTTNILDFLTVDQINNVAEIVGKGRPVPTLTDTLAPATTGNFMQDGLAKDVIRAGGETVPAAVGAGGLMRNAASRLPAATPAESTTAGAIRQMGGSTAAQDASIGLTSGAGSEIGESVGGAVGGETGEQVGSFAGAIVAPLATAGARSGINAVRETAATNKALGGAAPTSKNLKDAARTLYQQIDDKGVTIPQKPLKSLSSNIESRIKSEGFNARIHPKTAAALDEISKATDEAMSPGDLDILRRVAGEASKSFDNPSDARLGRMIVREIDDFMANQLPKEAGMADGDDISNLYRQAQSLWGRARKADLIDEAVTKAQNQASGFENGMRVQFRQILNNKKRRAGFTPEEIEAMTKVVRGGKAENIARALGKFGFTEGQASSMLMGTAGLAGGAYVGGTPGAVAVALTGQSAKKLAQELTRRNVELAGQLVKAGSNGREIVSAYLKNTPKEVQTAKELTSLLVSQKVPASELKALSSAGRRIVADAAYFASVVDNQDE